MCGVGLLEVINIAFEGKYMSSAIGVNNCCPLVAVVALGRNSPRFSARRRPAQAVREDSTKSSQEV